MAHNQLDLLLAIAPPPEGAGSGVDWPEVERRLGTRLPTDYTLLIASYGEGSFDDFIWVLHPTTINPNLHLDTQIRLAGAALREVNDTFAASHELMPWAITDNGDACYWLMSDTDVDPEDWRVAVNESRGPEWDVANLTASGWLGAVLSGRLRLPFFPPDFPTASPRFRQAANHENPSAR